MIQPKADISIDPEYTGDFFRQILPNGLIIETKDRIGIDLNFTHGKNSLKDEAALESDSLIGYECLHHKE